MTVTKRAAPILLSLFVAGGLAQAATVAKAADDKPATTASEPELTPEEQAEREGRKACKVAICDAFRNKTPDGGDIACSIVKSFRKEQLQKIVAKSKVSWPWGRVICKVDIKAKRDLLIKAMTDPKLEAQFDKHQISCTVERDQDGPAAISAELSPKITFEAGKATKAVLNWGKVDGPSVVKGAMWTATAADNTLNVLQSMVVDDVNDFVGKKCDEVKDAWEKK